MRRALVTVLALGLLALPGPPSSGSPTPHDRTPDATIQRRVRPKPIPKRASAMKTVNYYRRMMRLDRVTRKKWMARGARKHARYMVKENDLTHEEDPDSPWYTKAGDKAGRNSNVAMGRCRARKNVEGWMATPFHGVQLMDPRWKRTGFGLHREGGSCAAALDTIRGRNDNITWDEPVLFPGRRRTVPLRRFMGESPDPLTSCPSSYQVPAGLPIMAAMPDDIAPGDAIKGRLFKRGTKRVKVCVFGPHDYEHPNTASRDLGRSILDDRNAVVIIPKRPLKKGIEYRAKVKVGAETVKWKFFVAK